MTHGRVGRGEGPPERLEAENEDEKRDRPFKMNFKFEVYFTTDKPFWRKVDRRRSSLLTKDTRDTVTRLEIIP